MEAREIIKAVGLTYAQMETYQDVGTVKIIKGEPEVSESVLAFKTSFMRPQFIRYETSQTNRTTEARFVLWCDGQKVARQSNGYTQLLSENALFRNTIKDLDRALSPLREAKSLICLLMEKLKGPRLTELEDFKLISEEIYAGTACGRLRSSKRSESTEIWISKANYTIIRLVEQSIVSSNDETIKVMSQPKASKKISLVYEYDFQNIRVNEPISSALFEIPKT
jgi:hypothetical protein